MIVVMHRAFPPLFIATVKNMHRTNLLEVFVGQRQKDLSVLLNSVFKDSAETELLL